MDIRVISIGTMACNELWGEREPVRTGHATTTLIRTEDATIIVDPSLPPQALQARLGERAAITPDQVTHVFLTSFNPEARRGLPLFDAADWLIAAPEREAVGIPLASDLKHLAESGLLDNPDEEDKALVQAIQNEIAILQRCHPAPDRIAPGVDLFPLPGVTRGLTGLLIPSPRGDLLITGDAIPSREHLEMGRAPARCDDPEAAKASLIEAIEIADIIIPGRDNIVLNLARRTFPGHGPGMG
jgi:glyoxylase-like metal-dependent hydrolase (beta-lactamase superfamily II)